MAQILDRKSGRNITVLDVRNYSSVTDFYVVASGNSVKHIETLVTAPSQELKTAGFPPLATEGLNTPWVVADFNDVVLHVFDDQTRQHYDLENLWKAAPRIDWSQKKNILSSAV
jgi:ribosome-associated protein